MFTSAFRLCRRFTAFCGFVIIVSARYLTLRWHGPLSSSDRERWTQESAQRLARALNLKITVTGALPDAGLIASNHLGYLDIIAIATVTPGIFVSKSEVRYWPVIGFLSQWAGTLYLNRKRRSEVGKVGRQITHYLESGRRVIVFPEGTSSDGNTVLPFHSSLFAPALKSRCPVTPCHIRYDEPNQDPGHHVAYWGSMLFLTHFLKLLMLDWIHATLSYGPPIHAATNRKSLAVTTHQQVMQLATESAANLRDCQISPLATKR